MSILRGIPAFAGMTCESSRVIQNQSAFSALTVACPEIELTVSCRLATGSVDLVVHALGVSEKYLEPQS